MIRTNMKKILKSGVFWGSVTLFVIIMVVGVYTDLLAAKGNQISVIYFYLVTNSVGIAHVLVPIITIIPFTFFYVEELDKKAVYYKLIRCSKKNYYVSNIVTSILSSVLVSVIALTVFFIICIVFGANFSADSVIEVYYEGTYFEAWIENEQIILLVVVNVIMFLLFSIPWGLLSLAVSVLSKNKYIIIASPFIIFMGGSCIAEMMSLSMLHPGLMLLKGAILKMPYGGIFYATGYHMVFSFLFSVFYYVMSKRRFVHEGI